MSQTGLRAGARRSRAGFTLVELMVTIFLAAILLAIAVPSFQHITVSSRLTTTANSLVGALNAARMEAIKRNSDVQFCGTVNNGSDALGAACGNNQPGAVYALNNDAGTITAQRVQAAPAISSTSMHPVVQGIRFDPRGLGHAVGESAPYNKKVAAIYSDVINSNNYRIITMTTGSILETTKCSGQDCP